MGTAPETVTGEVVLKVGGETMSLRVTVPTAPTAMVELLPIFQHVASALANQAAERDTADGHVVSCRHRCSACCRQPVPVAPSEARALAAVVAAMPEPRRVAVTARFAAARAAVAASGITAHADTFALTRDDRIAWGRSFTALRVACPFLEDEVCSIYPDRPTICREYLVTTPRENCAAPATETIRRVPIAGSIAAAIVAVDRAIDGHGPMLLIDSLAWVAANPAPPPSESGPVLVQTVIDTLAANA